MKLQVGIVGVVEDNQKGLDLDPFAHLTRLHKRVEGTRAVSRGEWFNTIDKTAVRSRAIERKLRDAQELPVEQAQTVLMLENHEEDGEVEESLEAEP